MAESKGSTASGTSSTGVTAAARARVVGLNRSSAPRNRASAARQAASSVSPRGMTRRSDISPVVMVPVLSRHSTSTRARVSMPYSSCTSVLRLPSRTTPTASATLVSRISPSGIMPTMAATAPGTASFTGTRCSHTCLPSSASPMGTSAMDTKRTRRFRSAISADLGCRIFRAWRVSRLA